jgi:hypothetical protein
LWEVAETGFYDRQKIEHKRTSKTEMEHKLFIYELGERSGYARAWLISSWSKKTWKPSLELKVVLLLLHAIIAPALWIPVGTGRQAFSSTNELLLSILPLYISDYTSQVIVLNNSFPAIYVTWNIASPPLPSKGEKKTNTFPILLLKSLPSYVYKDILAPWLSNKKSACYHTKNGKKPKLKNP